MSARTLLLITLHLLIAFLPAAKAKFFYAFHFCPNATSYSSSISYASNLRTLLASLSSNSSISLFRSASFVNRTAEPIHAFYQCRGDLSSDECKACVANATTDVIRRCPTQKSAVIWYDECELQFSNETLASVLDTSQAYYLYNTQNTSDSERKLFSEFVRSDLNDCATAAAASASKFAVKERNTYLNFSITDRIYSLAQCTDDLSDDDCSQCLQDAISLFPACCSRTVGARVLYPSCNFRFELYAFYNISGVSLPPPLTPSNVIPTSGNGGISAGAIVAIVIPAGALTVLICVCCFVFARRRRRSNIAEFRYETGSFSMTEESLRFDFSTIKAATNNFSPQNLIGFGGFGNVYKGTLKDGQEIAVKRLSGESNQGETEFKNEAILFANLQHKNLTRLLGFYWDAEEKILVYEFVHNKSLDRYLFDPEKRGQLSWPRRYKIIEGIARGMLYLHEDSRLKIIHRDLKPSNVLLDGYFNPKISDFGTARICGADETTTNTSRIVGTWGYLSPEYAMHGQVSIKSDVYSFGVLVLEIITGWRVSEVHRSGDGDGDGDGDLISAVWQHWRDGKALEVVDKSVGDFAADEAVRCIHVALLCVQDSPLNRPTMATVVLMLSSFTASAPLPQQPHLVHLGSYGSSKLSGSDQFPDKVTMVSAKESDITEVYPR